MSGTNIGTVHTITSGLASMLERFALRSTRYHSLFEKCEAFILRVPASRDTDHRRFLEDKWWKGMKSRDKIAQERTTEKSKRAVHVPGSREYTRANAAIVHDCRPGRRASPCHVLPSCSYAVSKLRRGFLARLSEAFPVDIVPPQPLPGKHISPTTRQLKAMLDDGRICSLRSSIGQCMRHEVLRCR